MGKTTAIEYCDSTINPVMGCTGCELYSRDPALNHCYAARLCRRYAGCKGWPKDFEQPEYFPGRIEQALRWSDLTGTDRPDKPWLNGMPRLVFVNDLSDGFCPDAPAEPSWLNLVNLFAMSRSPHIWLLLTKWPERMRAFFAHRHWPIPPNFWLGTTVTRPRNVARADALLDIPARVHWLSLEPLLGPVGSIWPDYWGSSPPKWVVIGGQSGPNAQPMRPEWIYDLRDQCRQANMPFFFKQWGEWAPCYEAVEGWWCLSEHNGNEIAARIPNSTEILENQWDERTVARVGKKRAGRLLAGREWSEMPHVG